MSYNYLVIFLLLSFYEWQIKLFCIVDYINIVRQVLCPLQSLKWIICYQTLWLTRFIMFPTFPGHFYFWLTIQKVGVILRRKDYSITVHEHLCYYNLRKEIFSHQVSLTYQAYRVFHKPWLTGNKLDPTNLRGK